jgi:hypothetical protein
MECLWVTLPGRADPVRYTRHHVQAMLQFMGCKTLHAVRLTGPHSPLSALCPPAALTVRGTRTDTVFAALQEERSLPPLPPPAPPPAPTVPLPSLDVGVPADASVSLSSTGPSPPAVTRSHRRTGSVPAGRAVPLARFEAALGAATAALEYAAPSFLSDVEVARQVKDHERPLCILLGGTSGCGKSTLGSLLASRLGITTVVSTDHVRQLLRSAIPTAAQPLLWASSYHAGDALPEPSAAGMSPTERVRHGPSSHRVRLSECGLRDSRTRAHAHAYAHTRVRDHLRVGRVCVCLCVCR